MTQDTNTPKRSNVSGDNSSIFMTPDNKSTYADSAEEDSIQKSLKKTDQDKMEFNISTSSKSPKATPMSKSMPNRSEMDKQHADGFLDEQLDSPSTTSKPSESTPLQLELNSFKSKYMKHINLLLIGEKGVGKSSLLSTFHRSLHADLFGTKPICPVGNKKTSSFTKRIKYYLLNQNQTIVGHDTRGLETLMRPELEQVKAIRDGRVRDDVEIRQKDQWGFWDYLISIVTRNPDGILDPSCLSEDGMPISTNSPPTTEESPLKTLESIPHAVIFVVPANQRRIPHELAEFVALFVEYGYHPQFAVTKIDCHGGPENDLYAATNLYDNKKEEIMRKFPFVNYHDIKPIQNYTQWQNRDMSIENLALTLLQKTKNEGETFIEKFISQQKAYEERGSICVVS